MPNNLKSLSQDLPSYKNNESSDDDILWHLLWDKKWFILVFSALFAVASVLYALSKPNVYRASTILAPVSSEGGGGLAALAGQFGGLASMAGINIGGGVADKTVLALEIIRSRVFLENFIKKHDLLVPLIAAKSWDISSNRLVLDSEIYDEENNKWIRQVPLPMKTTPSYWEGYQRLLELLTVAQNDKTSMIAISLEFYAPLMAKEWLELLIGDLNEHIRAQDKAEAEASINYLTLQLQNIEVSSMETVFYQLIEEQTKNMMLTHVKSEYIFKTVEPAQVPDIKAGPKRAIIVIVGTFLGSFLSILIVLVRYFIKQ